MCIYWVYNELMEYIWVSVMLWVGLLIDNDLIDVSVCVCREFLDDCDSILVLLCV